MTIEFRNKPNGEATEADAVLGIRAGDMPVKVQEYAQNVHGQMEGLYARIGIASCEEIEGLPREALLAHAEDIAQLEHLLLRLHEALMDPERVERRVEARGDIAWYETVAERLAKRANEVAMPWGRDPQARVESAVGSLRFEVASLADGELVKEEVREELVSALENIRGLVKNDSLMSQKKLVMCAYDVGETGWADQYARDMQIETSPDVLAAQAKAYARDGNAFAAAQVLKQCLDEMSRDGSGQDKILSVMSDVVPVVYAAAAKIDDAALAQKVTLHVHPSNVREVVFEQAFARVLASQDLITATRIAQWSGISHQPKDALQARYDAGEDVREELLEFFAVRMNEVDLDPSEDIAIAGCSWAVEHLRAYPEDMVRCYERLAAASERGNIDCALLLGNLALAIGQDVAPYLVVLEEKFGTMTAAKQDEYASKYATLLYAAGQRSAASDVCLTADAYVQLVAAIVRKEGNTVEIPTFLDAAQDLLWRHPVDNVQLQACEVAIAVGDQVRADRLELADNSLVAAQAESLVRQFGVAGMSPSRVLAAIDAYLRGGGAGDAKMLKKYVQLSTATDTYSRDIDYVKDIAAANAAMGTSAKKATIVQWLWEGAVEAAEKAKQLKRAHGV